MSPTNPKRDKSKLFVNSEGSEVSVSETSSNFESTYMKSIKIPMKPTLSFIEIEPSARVRPSKRIDSANGNKFHNCVLDDSLKYKHETPKISAMFEIFEPIAVPRAMSSLSLKIAEIPTNISGAEVPNAIKVNPITRSLTPRCFARTEA